jgi:hypothetical protein
LFAGSLKNILKMDSMAILNSISLKRRESKINHEYPNNAVIHDCMLGHD